MKFLKTYFEIPTKNFAIICTIASLILPTFLEAQFIQQGEKFNISGVIAEETTNPSCLCYIDCDISKDGNTAIIGGLKYGIHDNAAWIFTRKDTAWTYQARLIGTGSIGPPVTQGSVAISDDGNTVVTGPNQMTQGIWAFTRTNNQWTPMGGFTGTGGFMYGTDVDISGDGKTIIVGATSDSGYVGAVWIFVRSGNNWIQQGSSFKGTGVSRGGDNWGNSVSLSYDGNTAAVGGANVTGGGGTWIFTRTGTTWKQQGNKLLGTGSIGDFGQGSSVSLSADGNTLAMGNANDNFNGKGYIGSTYIFTRSGTTWTQQGAKLIGTGAGTNGSYQGKSVSLSADGITLAVGGNSDYDNTGESWIFTRTGNTWTQLGNKLVGTGTVNDDNQGQVVALSGDGNTLLTTNTLNSSTQTTGYYMETAWAFERLPKLTASSFSYTPPGGVYPSDSIIISYSLKNIDAVTSPNVFIQHYLSYDTILDIYDYGADVSPMINSGYLAAGASKSISNKVLIPFTKAYQDFYIFIVKAVNSGDPNIALSKSNILLRSAVKVGMPRYTILNTKITPVTISQGDNVSISYSIRNDGNISPYVAIPVQYFISPDTIVDDTDILLTPTILAGIIPAGTIVNFAAKSYQIPLSVRAGKYFILVAENNSRTVQETYPSSTTFQEVTIIGVADLQVTTFLPSNKTVYPGFPVNLKATVKNSGGNIVNTTNYLRYCLSKDATYDSGDILLADSVAIARVPAYDSISLASKAFTIPVSTVAGNYYLIAIADINNKVTELLENNNSKAIAIKVGTGIDLTGTTGTINPGTVVPGKNVTVQFTVNNTGDTAASSFSVRYFLSTNTTYESGDVFLADSSVVSTVAAKGAFIVPSKTLDIPAGTGPGSYNILCVIDQYNKIPDVNKANNVYSLPLKIATLADLTLTKVTQSQSSIVPGNTFSVSYSVNNTGGTDAAGSYSVNYYLSRNTTLEATDVLLTDSILPGAVTAGGSISVPAKILQISSTQDPGDYYILLVVDKGNTIPESNEQNNISSSPIKIAFLADLTITGGNAIPDNLIAGVTTSVSGTINNIGGMNVSGGSSIHYFLSTNIAYDGSDLQLTDSIHVGAIAAGGSLPIPPAAIKIPANQPPGSYYILVIADVLNKVTESDDNNNISSIAIKILTLPDLSISNGKTLPTIAAPGGKIAVSYEINNGGETATPSDFSISYFLSSNTLYDKEDFQLGDSTHKGPLAAAGKINVNPVTLQLPAKLASGIYFILVVGDYENKVIESNDDNNLSSIPISVAMPADLTISKANASPSSVVPGSPTNLSITVNNNGEMDAPAGYSINYFLSDNATYDIRDQQLTDSIHPAELKAGASLALSAKTLQIPALTQPGNYFLLIIADLENQLPESNENNNLYALPITLSTLADVLPGNLLVDPTSVLPGNSINISASLKNQGGTPIDKIFNLQYFLSKNAVLDSEDVALSDTIHIPALNAGDSFNAGARSYLIPPSTISGNYFILAVADKEKILRESTTDNNVISQILTVGSFPDLTIENPSVSPSLLLAGESTSISCSIFNLGGTSTIKSFNVQYFLSKDDKFDAKDIILGNKISVTQLASGSSINVPAQNYTISPISSPGAYFLLLVVDPDSTIIESSEGNNLKSIPFTINSLPDLVISISTVSPLQLSLGDSVNISCTVTNNGTGPSLNIARLQYFLSTDQSYDNNDLALSGVISIPTLGAKASTTISLSRLKIPATATAGAWNVILYIDPDNTIKEIDENNNSVSKPISISALPDLKISSLEVNPSTLFQGDVCSVSGKVINQGSGAVTVPFSIQCYLSKDLKFDKIDVPFGSPATLLGLADGETSQEITVTNTIAPGTESGTYYILMIADIGGKVKENDVSNNISGFKITIGDPSLTDLAISIPIVNPTIIVPGDSVYIECNVKNIGQAKAIGKYAIQYFLTKEFTYDNSAIPIGAPILLSELAVGTILQIKPMKFKLPETTVPGSYNIILFVDVDNSINEANEENNFSEIPIRVLPLPDLKITKSTLVSQTFYAGNPITINASLKNTGGSPINIFSEMQFYLSSDATFNSTDIPISNDFAINPLLVSESVDTSARFTIPLNTLAGNYYIIIFADKDNLITETDKTNNFSYIPITVKPRPLISLPDSTITAVPVGKSVTVTATVKSDVPVASVIFSYRKITDSTRTLSENRPLTSGQYSVTIPANFFDQIGVEYFFQATDINGNISLPKEGTVNVYHGKPGLTIPYTSFGAKIGNYRIVSVPLELRYKNVDSIFTKILGPYNKAVWRIFNYRDSTNVEFQNGLQTIEAGKGYWLIIKNDNHKLLETGEGTTVKAKAAKPYSLQLVKGWNQIGNPYNFDMNWKHINAFNNKKDTLISWIKYEGEWNKSDTLHKMEGGFILSSHATALYFPTQNNSAAFRLGTTETAATDENNWQLPLHLSADEMKYSLGGIGMSSKAKLSKDEMDDFTPPRFSEWLEVDFYHPEYFYPKFTKDIVPSCDEFIWNFTVESSIAGRKNISWNNSVLKNSNRKLILYDIADDHALDMNSHQGYSFESNTSRSFKIFYGDENFIENNVNTSSYYLGNPFPNPFSESTLFSLSLPNSLLTYQIIICVYNAFGQKVTTITQGNFQQGLLEFNWDGRDSGGKKQGAGLYFVDAQIKNGSRIKSLNKKVLLR